MKHIDEIINFLVKNEIFLHLEIRWCNLVSCITDKFKEKQKVRYTPSVEHRIQCKDDLCHFNAKLEVINPRESLHQKKCTVL